MPAAILAAGIVDNWWRLLYEPQKAENDLPFELRHRLDGLTSGYVFPPLAIWSGGETIVASLMKADARFQKVLFTASDRKQPWILPRDVVESSLGIFVETVIARFASSPDSTYVREAWQRIVDSNQDSDERTWCVNAGRLGFDPYDPDTPDLDRMAGGLSDSLFADICEVTSAEELSRTAAWVESASFRLKQVPPISLQNFGAAPKRDLSRPGYKDGYDSATLLRSRLGLPVDPTRPSSV